MAYHPIFLLASILFFCVKSVQADIYRCQDSGKLYFSDRECPNAYRKDGEKWIDVDAEKIIQQKIKEEAKKEELRKMQEAEKKQQEQLYRDSLLREIEAKQYEQNIKSNQNLNELKSMMHCKVAYSDGLKHLLIYAVDETGTYAINGKARAISNRNGWIDGYRKFSPEQMQILLQLGISKCK